MNEKDRKTGVKILISVKIDFKIKAIKEDKRGHYVMINRCIQGEYTTVISIYAPNVR